MNDLLYHLLSAALVVGVLAGIALMSREEAAVKGNAISAVCIVLAIVLTLYRYELLSERTLWISLSAGLVTGLLVAWRVKMIAMPQMIALLNGFGGAASTLVATASLLDGTNPHPFSTGMAALALVAGSVTLSGSLVAAAKLQKLVEQKPMIWPSHGVIINITLLCITIVVVTMPLVGVTTPGLPALIVACIVLSIFFGVAFTVRVGGAEMPITISLLNAFSGIAGAFTGMAIDKPLLVAVGGVVGAAGLVLTQIMCQSMNRHLADILLGEALEHESALPAPRAVADAPAPPAPDTAAERSTGEILATARKVIVVPGYGMAVARAQAHLKKLTDRLEANGSEVVYAIHPVAGRMPRHMNMLLCEVDIPYKDIKTMVEANPQFAQCDVALVVGANDVINPAANTAEGTPIYGMPVLEVEKASHLIICNLDRSPGYAGVANPLYAKPSGVTLLLGDAGESLQTLQKDLAAATGEAPVQE